jgi:hypothetical protein
VTAAQLRVQKGERIMAWGSMLDRQSLLKKGDSKVYQCVC